MENKTENGQSQAVPTESNVETQCQQGQTVDDKGTYAARLKQNNILRYSNKANLRSTKSENKKVGGQVPQKLKDNNIFRYSIIALSLAIMIVAMCLPAIGELSSSAISVIGIFVGTLILWLTISIDWPSLLCILMLGLVDGLSFKSLFSSSFGSDTFVFLLCTFIFTYSLSTTNIIKKVSVWFITNKFSKKSPWHFVTMYTFSIILLGMFISPSVLFVILLPILEEILRKCEVEKGSKLGTMLMLTLAFAVSISSGMTPIAHVFPIISMGIYTNVTGATIGYAQYMAIAIPVGILTTILMLVVFRLFLRPDMSKLKTENLDKIEKTEKLTKRDILILSIVMLVILLWVLPSLLQSVWPQFYSLFNGYGTAFPAIIGVVLMSIIKCENKPLVSVGEACKKGVPFSSLIMCAGTLALSSAITSDAVGLKAFLTDNMSTLLVDLLPYALLVIFAFWATLQTNVSSNMVTATVVTTIAVPILQSTGAGGAILPTTVVVIGMLSAYAFATPPSMPHIAIAASSDYATTKDTLTYGSILGIIAVLLSISVGYAIGLMVF